MGTQPNEEPKVAIVFEHTVDSRRGPGHEMAQVKDRRSVSKYGWRFLVFYWMLLVPNFDPDQTLPFPEVVVVSRVV